MGTVEFLCTVDDSRWHHCTFWFLPFPLCQISEGSPLLQVRLLSHVQNVPVKLINYACDLWPLWLQGGCMNAAHSKAKLAMSGLVSKQLHSRAWYCYGKMFSCIIFSLDSIVYSVDHSTVSVHIPVQRLQTPLEVLHYRLMMCNVLDMPRYECDNWNFEEVVPVISYTVCLFLPWESPYI